MTDRERTARVRAALVSACLTALLPCPSAGGQPADLRGIYVYTNDVSQISPGTANALTASFNVPGVDGVAVVIGWKAIEPAMGRYQWSTLDLWLNGAISLGKKIDLVVMAGSSTPTWLFQPAPDGAGAGPLAFTFSPHGGATGVCQSATLAAPWDPAFLGRWDSLLAAVASHLTSAGTYGAVRLLRLTGINRSTEELRLPAETAQSTGLACVTDAIATWQQAGYRPSRLLQAWDAITGSFQKSFPDKPFGVSIIPQNPFPAIAEDGSVITGVVPDQNQPLLQLASQKFPGRLVVQFDFLMPGEPAQPRVIQAAETLGTLAAFQTNEYLGSTGQGAACSEPVTNPAPCTNATFLQMLETGIFPLGRGNPLRSQYIEVFHANATAFPDAVERAHLELLGIATGCPSPDTTLCLDDRPGDGRFRVEIAFQTSQGGGRSGDGRAIPLAPLGITHGGAFWFFSPDNPEMLAKMLDGCAANGQKWFFASAGTNVGYAATVLDTLTGHLKTYTNPDLNPAAPIGDTAFEPCAAPSSSLSARLFEGAAAAQPLWTLPITKLAGAAAAAPCVPGPATLCLDGAVPGDKRFKVEVSFQTSQGGGHAGQGQAIPLSPVGIAHGGAFWFFSADNPEMLVKVVDGCSVDSSKWFFASAGTNVGFAVTLTDTKTGAQKTYMNTDLNQAPPIQDTAALSSCP